LAAAATVGSAIEWYDFYVYGTSVVLVLGPLFFPTTDPLTGTLLAFATFGVGFLARPVGAVVLSHLGDRIGRKHALVWSLLLMGGATVAVGLLPTYEQVGAWAPILLISLRLVQGFAVGGEWGGAVLLVLEHAPPGRRTLWGSFPQYGTPAGLLASSVAIMLAAALPDEAFYTWGWRLPFLVSAALVVVGLWVRWSVQDAEEFLAVRRAGALRRRPLVHVFVRHRRAVLVGTAATFVCHAAYIVSSFLPSYATTALGASDQAALLALVVASVVGMLVLFGTGLRSRDRDPRPLAVAGSLLSAVWVYPAFLLAGVAGSSGLVVGITVGLSVLMLQYCVLPALLAAQFPVEVRYTGISMCFQISAVLGGGLLPIVAGTLVNRADGHFAPAAALLVFAGVVSCLGALKCAGTSETRRSPGSTTRPEGAGSGSAASPASVGNRSGAKRP
jgi:MFS family permease